MIGRLRGTLAEKQPPHLILDVNGIGYELEVPMTTLYRLPALGEPVTLHTHLVVREDAHLLYGFAEKRERELFRELIRLNGVGPKLAQRIVLELKDKVAKGFVDGINLEDVGAATAAPAAQGAGQAIAALVSLGYSQSEAALAVSKIDASLPVEEIIKLALRGMAGRR